METSAADHLVTRAPVREQGFTLIESLVAIAILAFVVIGFLGVRTSAMMDAADARNLRLARELAHERLSQLLAGAVEIPPTSGERNPVEGYPGFELAVYIGENAVTQAEEDFAETSASDEEYERLEWQREREQLRRAERSGVSLLEYEDQLLAEENEITPPSEYEFEEVSVVVFYPNVTFSQQVERMFTLKARVSTAALQGLTPDRVEAAARTMGDEEGAATTAAHRHPNAADPAGEGGAAAGEGGGDPAGALGGGG